MSIATALSSLRKRERAIRNSLASKGICTAPNRYDNDTSAIIDKIDSVADAKERLLKGLAQTAIDIPDDYLDEIDLRSVGLANGMSRVSAFTRTNVKSAVLPSNCQSLNYTFKWCTQLSSLKFSWAKSVDKDTIASFLATGANKKLSGAQILSGCTSLTAVPDFIPATGDRQVYGLTGNDYLFARCTGISSLDCAGLHIANTASMPSYMFYGCTSLTGIEPGDIVPETGNAGGTYQFANCTSLGEVFKAWMWFGGYCFSDCSNLSVVRQRPLGGDFVSFGSSAFRNCTSLICVDFSHCTLSNSAVGAPTAAQITAGNSAKFVWPEAMRTKLQSSSWLTNTTIASRVEIVPDPKEMIFTYADGTKLEFSFAQIGTNKLFNNGAPMMQSDTWMPNIRAALTAHGPISDIVDISCSKYFESLGQGFFSTGSGSGLRLSAVHLPFACWLNQEFGRYLLSYQENIKTIDETFFPNCTAVDAPGIYFDKDIYDVTFPKARLVYKPFSRAVLTGDLVVPRARALGLSVTTVGGHVYAPSLECLIWTGSTTTTDRGRNYLWMDKLSGVNWDNVDCIQHDTEAYLSGQWVTQLSNVRSIDYYWRYETNKKFGNLAVQSVSGLHLPYVRALSSLRIYDGVSDLQMPQLFYLDWLNMHDARGYMTVSLPGLETVTSDAGIILNGYSIATNQTVRQAPALLSVHLPNIADFKGFIGNWNQSSQAAGDTKYADSRVSLVLDFSGRTVLSEDGKIHMPNPSFNSTSYGDSSLFGHALSQLLNLYNSVQIKFDRELSSEVLSDVASNHWMYTKDGVHWPEAITSCYTFV